MIQLEGTIEIKGRTAIEDPRFSREDYREVFLSRRSILWAPEMGDPRQLINRSNSTSTLDLIQAQVSDVLSSSDRPRLFNLIKPVSKDAGLIGSIRIPFEFLLRTITDSETLDRESLPPTLDRGISGKIEYTITVTIRFSGAINKSERLVFWNDS
jgi:hypothetical protein